MSDKSQFSVIDMERIDSRQLLDLRAGDAIQLQDSMGDQLRYYVRLIGIENGREIVVSHPLKDDVPLPFEDGHDFLVRVLSGNKLYEFSAQVLGSVQAPEPSMSLTFPAEVEGMTMHADLHIKPPALTGWIERKNSNVQGSTIKTPLRITVLGMSGMTVRAKRKLGDTGNQFDILFQLPLNGMVQVLVVTTAIRSSWQETPQGEKDEVTAHELEFIKPDEHVRTVLQSYIYKTLAEGPVE